MIITLDKEKVDKIFARNADSGRCLMELYLSAIPEGVHCEKWPKAGKALHKHLLDKFGEFSDEDRRFWATHGFGLDLSIGPWEVNINGGSACGG